MNTRDIIRKLIEALEDGVTVQLDSLLELERHIIHDDGIKHGLALHHTAEHDHSCDYTIQGKLEATERHLADMRRLVLLENERGDV